jgi:hypothetical protein
VGVEGLKAATNPLFRQVAKTATASSHFAIEAIAAAQHMAKREKRETGCFCWAFNRSNLMRMLSILLLSVLAAAAEISLALPALA